MVCKLAQIPSEIWMTLSLEARYGYGMKENFNNRRMIK
jgi:hypothetical protein